jgi:RNA polymerase sigma factor (sigma-70 family)
MAQHNDQQYIDALLNNDAVLINELYARYADKIRVLVLKNNGTESDAADVFQDALLAIYQRAKNNTFILTCPLDAYLYLICKNRWINELNRRGTQKVTFIDEEGYTFKEDVFKEVEILQNEYERGSLLEQKFKELGDGCRELLELSWSGLAMDEVAKKLQNSYGYIRKKKSECMAKLIALVKKSPQFVSLQW